MKNGVENIQTTGYNDACTVYYWGYTNSLVNATFGSGKKSCYAKFVSTKLVNKTWREIRVSEGISVS